MLFRLVFLENCPTVVCSGVTICTSLSVGTGRRELKYLKSGSFLPGEPAQEAEGERYSKLENVKSKGVQNGGKIDT